MVSWAVIFSIVQLELHKYDGWGHTNHACLETSSGRAYRDGYFYAAYYVDVDRAGNFGAERDQGQ